LRGKKKEGVRRGRIRPFKYLNSSVLPNLMGEKRKETIKI